MKPHRTDGVSLSFGLIFVMIVLFWAFAKVVTVNLAALGWIVASALLLFGVLGVLGALRSGRRRDTEPVHAEAVVEPAEGVSNQMHAEIVKELLTQPGAPLTTETVTEPRHSRD